MKKLLVAMALCGSGVATADVTPGQVENYYAQVVYDSQMLFNIADLAVGLMWIAPVNRHTALTERNAPFNNTEVTDLLNPAYALMSYNLTVAQFVVQEKLTATAKITSAAQKKGNGDWEGAYADLEAAQCALTSIHFNYWWGYNSTYGGIERRYLETVVPPVPVEDTVKYLLDNAQTLIEGLENAGS